MSRIGSMCSVSKAKHVLPRNFSEQNIGKTIHKKALSKAQLKCTKPPGRQGFAPDPSGELTALPKLPSWWGEDG